MDEWFRWGFGILFVLLTGWCGWLTISLQKAQNDLRQLVVDLDKRLAIMEDREQVDPVAYTKAVTELSGLVSQLVLRMADHKVDMDDKFKALTRSLNEREKV